MQRFRSFKSQAHSTISNFIFISFPGINISHASLISGSSSITLINCNDVILYSNSLRWITGLILLLSGTINGARRIETTEAFSPKMQIRLIEKYKVTIVFNQAYYLIELLKSGLMSGADLSSVKHMMSSGCKVPLCTRDEFNSYLPNGCVNNIYGCTELATIISAEFPEYTGKDTVGRILDGFKIKIIDEDGHRCGVNVEGEICVKGRHKFLGYYKDEQLTAKAVDSENFFLTGDIGCFDENGYLYVKDRKKDVIYYEEWVFPSEIEETLSKSPQIKSACVVGVKYDPVLEVPATIIVRTNNSTITEEDVCKMVAGIFLFELNKPCNKLNSHNYISR